jgi:hypothetical protein
MKKNILILVCFVASFSCKAQYYLQSWVDINQNPGALNTDVEYPSGGGLSTTWSQIHGAFASPTWSAATTIPFPFQFNGSSVTQFKVSNSAVVTFDVGTALPAPTFTPSALPNAAIPDNSVCVWGLQGIGANDFVMSKTFGTAPNRQYWIFFTSYSTPGAAANYNYFSIVLEETSNNIYIVDQRNSITGTNPLTLGLQINGTSAVQVAGSPNANFEAGTDFTPNDNTYYAFIPGIQPAYDLSVTNISTNEFAVAGNVAISGTIKNLGTTTINSLTLNYTDNGGTPVSAPITGLNIAPNTNYLFLHPTQWNATIGTHTIAVYASNLNGNIDQAMANDQDTKVIQVLSKIIKRTPLIEVYTSSTCPPCKPGNENLHAIIDTILVDPPVTIKFQQDFPGTGDPYATAEAINRRTGIYAINSIPRLELDGGWDGNAGSFTYSLLNNAKNKPAEFEMNGEYVLNPTLKSVSGKVRYSPAFNNTAGSTLLHIAILENKTINNVKTNGEVEFTQVMKKMVPSNTGTILPAITSGNWDSIAFSYTFNGAYRLPTNGQTANVINHATEHSVEEMGDLYVIAWIQGTNKSVYQAAVLNGNFPTTITEVSNLIQNISVYPNPAKENVQINFENKDSKSATILLIDMKGDLMQSKRMNLQNGPNNTSFHVSELPTGVYSISIIDEKNNSITKQIVVE